MKTDSLFYELFRVHPAGLFELAGIEAQGEYVFESITVKSTEKRFDGFFRPKDGTGHNVFLEVQGYDDQMIYWRFFREIAAHHEQTKSRQPFTAIILFLDEKYDPKDCPVRFVSPNRLIRLYLPKCLKTVRDKASPLAVLKPLVFKNREKLPVAVPKWKAEIDSLKLPECTNKTLTELLETAIVSRFPKLTGKEIEKMIQLTPLDKTVAGQELIQMGIEKGRMEGLMEGRMEGRTEGIEKGELIGKIHFAQRLLKRRITPKKTLLVQSLKELRAMLRKLERELKIV